jgi:2-polyprenyl-3-methyl-5-hydroxy-6-metoxy-1,4-benzoquinol methylase
VIDAAGLTVTERALASQGSSNDSILDAAVRSLRTRGARGVVVDIGCGTGRFRNAAGDLVTSYVGVDIIRHGGLADDVQFVAANVDTEPLPVEPAGADIVVSLEVVEHLDHPRALFREAARICRPGGWLVVSTPNQASFANALSLAVRGYFVAFGPSSYPVHRTALLPIDLVRLSREHGFGDASVVFSGRGRIPRTSLHYPRVVSRLAPRGCSDNVIVAARRNA